MIGESGNRFCFIKNRRFGINECRFMLEHVPKKLIDFFDQNMLQLLNLSEVLSDQMSPFDRDAL